MAEYVPSDVWCDRLANQNGVWVIAEEKVYVSGQCSGADWWVFLPPGEYSNLVAAYKASLSGASSSQFTAEEVQALKYQAANPSPFNLTLEEGALIASAILGVWGVAVLWRSLGMFARGGSSEEDPR